MLKKVKEFNKPPVCKNGEIVVAVFFHLLRVGIKPFLDTRVVLVC